jgi:hypothetical protein
MNMILRIAVAALSSLLVYCTVWCQIISGLQIMVSNRI